MRSPLQLSSPRTRWLQAAALASLLLAAREVAADDGALDPAFNGTGKVVVDIGTGPDLAETVAVQRDGKVLLAGGSYVPTATGLNVALAVARLNADGTADTSFGPVGTGGVRIQLDLGTSGANSDWAGAIAQQEDGKIVVCGTASVTGEESHLAVVRLTSAGSLDATFGGGDGIVTYPAPASAGNTEDCSLLIRRDGKLLLTPRTSGDVHALLQLDVDGNPDPSFGTLGQSEAWTCPPEPGCHFVKTIEVPGGKLLTLGQHGDEVVVARFLGTGAFAGYFDLPFGTNGVASFPAPVTHSDALRVIDLALGHDGRVAVLAADHREPERAVLLRLRGDELDPAFGSSGWTTFGLPSSEADFQPEALFLQSDGKAVVVGNAQLVSGNLDFLVTRRTPDGLGADPSFSGGWRIIPFDLGGNLSDSALAAVGDAGRVLVAGWATSVTSPWDAKMVAARLENDLVWSDGFESGSTWW